ncbi:ATP-dependent exoDNAse (exonuclease V), alpha subunit, helicase superfamily I [Thermomonospora echinospora]|uniref:ATP-dependent exoDNAse (Exonuclease V), alpha subunit, helicase superfamily I n=1 Tax=Thermomonospora echinospora TaxID=1992 RepID=A0A1H6E5A8_9ACTN|nr:ATP-dependent exoDNAse (exonuclease V), alpha subunit, helicase superfamily I [Thermomonospora echinospora]
MEHAGNGGWEFYRHVEVVGALAQARFRAKTTALGFRWERVPGSRVWELAGVPARLREVFSKRSGQTSGMLVRLGIDPDRATTAQIKAASAMCREGKDTAPLAPASLVHAPVATGTLEADLRESWRRQTVESGADPDTVVAAARRGGGPDGGTGIGGPDGPVGPDLPPRPPRTVPPSPPSRRNAEQPAERTTERAERTTERAERSAERVERSAEWAGRPAGEVAERIAAAVFDPEHGLTAHAKVVTRPKLLAAVLDELPAGITSAAAAEELADAVVAGEGPAVRLERQGPAYRTHPERYTTRDIIAAEQQILAAARDGYQRPGREDEGLAVVDAQAAELAIETFEAAAGFELSREQREVIQRLTGAGHGVDAVVGVTGAGKTTLMAAARAAWEAAGMVVRGAAAAAVAAQALQAETGIPSSTIASVQRALEDPDAPGLDGVDVLVIDEAAMADDRQLADVLSAAQRTGTKAVLIGDPLQMKAIGVRGTLAEIHRQVAGPLLTENRRQREPLERRALQLWRAGDRHGALRTWAVAGRVHAGGRREDTLARMLTDWESARDHLARTSGERDVHEELDRLLMLTGTNADVDLLNQGARLTRRKRGEITGPDHSYQLATGGTLALAVGDYVRVRRNDYRTRHKDAPADAVDVLNGYRGIVTGFNGRDPVVQRRSQTEDGPGVETATIPAARIAAGDLSYGTAMTVASAQGLTSDITFVYGPGLGPHTVYPAMSRNRKQAHLYLPRDLLETDTDRARHGAPHSPVDELARAIGAYARTLTGDRADRLALTELGTVPAPPTGTPATEAAPAAQAAGAGRESIQPSAVPHWRKRPYGTYTDKYLDRLATAYRAQLDRFQRIEARTAAETAAARRGKGPAATVLAERRQALAQAADIEAQLTQAREEADQAGADIADATRQVTAARELTQHGRLALRMASISRAQAQQQLQDAHDAWQAACDRQTTAQQRTDRLARQAADAYRQAPALHLPGAGQESGADQESGRWHHGAATADLAALTRRWDEYLALAIRADLRTAPKRAAQTTLGRAYAAHLAGIDTPHQAVDADEAHRQLAAITTEQNLRRQMPTDHADQERTQRTQHHRRQTTGRTAHQAGRAAAHEQDRQYEASRPPGPRYDHGRGSSR